MTRSTCPLDHPLDGRRATKRYCLTCNRERNRRWYGLLERGIPDLTPEVVAAFWARVQRGRADECWEWQGVRHPFGYGSFMVRGRRSLAHRVSLAIDGRLDPDLMALHSCDNPPCVNPAHLRPGTAADNMADKVQRGRARNGRLQGSRNPAHRLTEQDVLSIRVARAAGTAVAELAARWGVGQTTVEDVIYGRSWRHV